MATKTERFQVLFDTKDVILYALSVGYGSSLVSDESDDELRYAFEHHDRFSVAPTFALTLLFRSRNKTPDCGLPPFPPPMMKAMGVIPPEYVVDKDISIEDYPMLHVQQSIIWKRDLPTPKREEKLEVSIQGQLVSIAPKSIGTFVTQKVFVYGDDESLLCTLESTFLLLGLESEAVKPFGTLERMGEGGRGKLLLEANHRVQENAALVYRVASYDTNRIHVDQSPLENRPILHGLCTMGMAARYLQRVCDGPLQSMQCRFTKPVFIGDSLLFQIWRSSTDPNAVSFVVRNLTRDENALSGVAIHNPKARI